MKLSKICRLFILILPLISSKIFAQVLLKDLFLNDQIQYADQLKPTCVQSIKNLYGQQDKIFESSSLKKYIYKFQDHLDQAYQHKVNDYAFRMKNYNKELSDYQAGLQSHKPLVPRIPKKKNDANFYHYTDYQEGFVSLYPLEEDRETATHKIKQDGTLDDFLSYTKSYQTINAQGKTESPLDQYAGPGFYMADNDVTSRSYGRFQYSFQFSNETRAILYQDLTNFVHYFQSTNIGMDIISQCPFSITTILMAEDNNIDLIFYEAQLGWYLVLNFDQVILVNTTDPRGQAGKIVHSHKTPPIKPSPTDLSLIELARELQKTGEMEKIFTIVDWNNLNNQKEIQELTDDKELFLELIHASPDKIKLFFKQSSLYNQLLIYFYQQMSSQKTQEIQKTVDIFHYPEFSNDTKLMQEIQDWTKKELYLQILKGSGLWSTTTSPQLIIDSFSPIPKIKDFWCSGLEQKSKKERNKLKTYLSWCE